MDFNSETYFMQRALQQAKYALQDGEVPVGALIECNGKIISQSFNNVEILKDATAHAEMIVISSACAELGSKYLSECTLYVTLEPCHMCLGATNWAKLKKIVYGASDHQNGGLSKYPNAKHKKTSVISGIMEKECNELLETFFKNLRE